MKLEIESTLRLYFRYNENFQENSSVAEILVKGYSSVIELSNYLGSLRIYNR
jgi:hypothetical protein